MPTLRLDTVQNSSGSLGPVLNEIRRGFGISEIDSSGDPALLIPSVMATPGMPQFGSFHPANYPIPVVLSRVEVTGLAPDAVSGSLVYSTIPGGGDGSAYLLTRSTRTLQMSSDVLPDGTIIKCGYSANGYDPNLPADDDRDPDPTDIPADYVQMTFRRPCTTLVADGIVYGKGNFDASGFEGFVNADVWQGRPAGSWLLDEFSTGYARYANTTSFRATVLGAPMKRKWWNTGIIRSSQTGKKAYYDGMQADIQAALQLPYLYTGDATGRAQMDGFVVVGGYPTVTFSSIGL